MVFSSEVSANGDFEKQWTIKSGPTAASCSIPPEFGGLGGGFSPEDLFLQSLMNCFDGTFKVYAKGSRISFSNLMVKGLLTVDKNPDGKVIMKSALLEIKVKGVDRAERVETIVEKTLRDGFILNSVKTEIHHTLEISA